MRAPISRNQSKTDFVQTPLRLRRSNNPITGQRKLQATTKGGPADSTQVFNIYMFRIFGEGLYAQASAMSLVLFLVVVVIAVPVILGMRRREQVLR